MLLRVLNTTELYTIEQTLSYVNYILIKLFFFKDNDNRSTSLKLNREEKIACGNCFLLTNMEEFH